MDGATIGKVLSGVLGAILATILAAAYHNAREKNLLIEKWMSVLRDELKTLLGLSEELRLRAKFPNTENDGSNPAFQQTIPIRSNIIATSRKIKLLLHPRENGKKKRKPIIEKQNKLEDAIDELIKLADAANATTFSEYDKAETHVVENGREILKYHWDKVQRGLSFITGFAVFIGIFLVIVIIA